MDEQRRRSLRGPDDPVNRARRYRVERRSRPPTPLERTLEETAHQIERVGRLFRENFAAMAERLQRETFLTTMETAEAFARLNRTLGIPVSIRTPGEDPTTPGEVTLEDPLHQDSTQDREQDGPPED